MSDAEPGRQADDAEAQADDQPSPSVEFNPPVRPYIERPENPPPVEPPRPSPSPSPWSGLAVTAILLVGLGAGGAFLGRQMTRPAQTVAPPALSLAMPQAPPRGLPVPAPAAAPSAALSGLVSQESVKGLWTGRYYYPDSTMPPVHFSVLFGFLGDRIVGQITEPNTFGNPSAPFLQAEITGSLGPGAAVHFVKRYDGTGGVSHSVFYDGTLSPDGRTIQGTWTIPGPQGAFSGAFQISR